jgi:hypothetical protein
MSFLMATSILPCHTLTAFAQLLIARFDRFAVVLVTRHNYYE